MRSAVLALLLATAAPAIAQNAPVETRQVGTATLENVPAIPAEVKAAVQRYQNYRDATFRDWLPDGSMLITTRFGTTSQVHRVAAPGAARTQLTFFDEPVGGVSAIPGSDRFLVTRDTGGVGLGLAICKSHLEAMSGHIDIDSDLGKGTTVIVTLPRWLAN